MDILKNSQFLKLWGNQILLQIAFNMSNFTALLLINQLTGSRFALSLFYAAMTLPAFIFGIFAGAIVDMTDRKKLMLITDAILAALFLAYAFSGQSLAVIILIAFASASVSQFFTPAEAATIPLLVKGESLIKANSLFLFTQLGSVMAGYALAGPVIQLFGGILGDGAKATFFIASFLTAIGFLLRLSLQTIEGPKIKLTQHKFIQTWLLTKEVFLTAKNDLGISLPIVLLTILEFNVGLLAIIFIDYVKKYLQLPTTSISYYLVIPLIIGLIAGVVSLDKLKKVISRGKLILLGIIAMGLVLFSLGIIALLMTKGFLDLPTLRLATILAAFIIGLAVIFIAVHARTILQENTPSQMLGRVFSLVTISASAVTPIPIMLVALFTEKVDVAVIFIFFGLALTLIGALLKKPLTKVLVGTIT